MKEFFIAGSSVPPPDVERVVARLKESGRTFTFGEISEEFQFDLRMHKAFYLNLTKHPDLNSWDFRFCYKWKHNLGGKTELLQMILKHPYGLSVASFHHAYPTVMKDLEELKVSGDIFLVLNTDTYEEFAYPGNFRFYKWKHNLGGKTELLQLILKHPEGVSVASFRHAYPTVMKDLEELKDSGDVFLVINTDTNEEFAFRMNDPRMGIPSIRADDELKELKIKGMKSAKRGVMAQNHNVPNRTRTEEEED